MRNIRIGNDIPLVWSVKKDGQPFSLEGADVKLFYKTIYNQREVTGFEIEENKISWTFYGKDQKYVGKYKLILIINDGQEGMMTTDISDAFKLVSSSKESGGEDCADIHTCPIEVESDVSLDTDTPFIKGAADGSAVLRDMDNIAEGQASVVMGRGNRTTNVGEVAVGTFNKSSEGKTAFSVGIGEDADSPANAIEVTSDGRVFIKGIGQYVGHNLPNATDLATYLDSPITEDELNELF